jgi:hypothetical protein
MAKTAAMIPPRYLVLENSAVMTALSGSEERLVMQSAEDDEVSAELSQVLTGHYCSFLDMVLTVSTYAYSHDNPIENEHANDRERGRFSAQRLSKRRRNDDHEFHSIHLLAPEAVS